jgi:hypothetical protein
MTPKLETLLGRLGPVVRDEILKVCVPNCCIATVAILRRVLKHFHFEARGFAVSMVVRNPEMVRFMEATTPYQRMPDDPAELERWMKRSGCWSIGIMPESRAVCQAKGYDGFGGHLVTLVQDVMVDCSLDQANRPQHNIHLPQMLISEAPPVFLERRASLVGCANGCEVVYTGLKDESWRGSPDWKHEPRYRETVNAIIKRVSDDPQQPYPPARSYPNARSSPTCSNPASDPVSR